MKKVLCIAYRFPPQGGGGVQRTVKFIKHLPEFGWQPIVHTVAGNSRAQDPEMLKDIPPTVSVHRTWTWEAVEAEKKMLRTLEVAPQKRSGLNLKKWIRKILGTIKRKVYLYTFVPDPQVLWLPLAFVRSLIIARREGATLLYSTSPPHSSQILGYLLHRLTGLPWVVDFRDLWILSIHREKLYNAHPWRRTVEEWWEGQIIRHASRVIVTTERSRQQLIGKYGLSEKFTVITNGFDPEDFSLAPTQRPWHENSFHLTLTGNVESLFDATPFFQALHVLLREDPEISRRLRVHFVGANLAHYLPCITSLGLDSVIRIHPYVPHSESVRFLQHSDALFLCQIPDPISAGSKLSGKLFEYMAAQKPILALTLHESLTADLLRQFGPGLIVHPNDENGIKAALRSLVYKTNQAAIPVNKEFLHRFERRQLTADLAALMHQALKAAA